MKLSEIKRRIKLLHAAGYEKLPNEKFYRKIWNETIKDDFSLELYYLLSSKEVMWPFINLEEMLEWADKRVRTKLKETKENYLAKGESNL